MQKEILYSYRGKKMKGKVLSPPLDTIPHHSETNFALERKYIIQIFYVSVTALVTFHRYSPVGLNTPLWGFSISASYKKATTLVRIILKLHHHLHLSCYYIYTYPGHFPVLLVSGRPQALHHSTASSITTPNYS